MKEIKVKNMFTKIKSLSKKALGMILILFIISFIISFKAITTPLQSQERIQSNKIIQKTSITYSADSLPDGITSVSGSIFAKLQKNLKVNIDSVITSQEPVAVKGEIGVNCFIIAEGMWQQTIPLTTPLKIDLNGNENTLIKKDFDLKLDDIMNRIEKNEDKIGTSPSKYIITIKPDFRLEADYKSQKIEVDNTAELSFEYSYGQIKLIGENKEFIKETPFEETKLVNMDLNLFGISLPLTISRYVFSGLTLILLSILIINIKSLGLKHDSRVLLAKEIDKKYKGRLINLQKDIDLINKTVLFVSSFKELVHIADERELVLMKYCGRDEESTNYYVIDNNCVFTYSAPDSDEVIEIDVDKTALGSDVSNG